MHGHTYAHVYTRECLEDDRLCSEGRALRSPDASLVQPDAALTPSPPRGHGAALDPHGDSFRHRLLGPPSAPSPHPWVPRPQRRVSVQSPPHRPAGFGSRAFVPTPTPPHPRPHSHLLQLLTPVQAGELLNPVMRQFPGGRGRGQGHVGPGEPLRPGPHFPVRRPRPVDPARTWLRIHVTPQPRPQSTPLHPLLSPTFPSRERGQRGGARDGWTRNDPASWSVPTCCHRTCG